MAGWGEGRRGRKRREWGIGREGEGDGEGGDGMGGRKGGREGGNGKEEGRQGGGREGERDGGREGGREGARGGGRRGGVLIVLLALVSHLAVDKRSFLTRSTVRTSYS